MNFLDKNCMTNFSNVIRKYRQYLTLRQLLLALGFVMLSACSLDAQLINNSLTKNPEQQKAVNQELTSGSQINVTTTKNYKVHASLGNMVNQIESVSSSNYKVYHSLQGALAGEAQ